MENPLDACLGTCHPDDRGCFESCVSGEFDEEIYDLNDLCIEQCETPECIELCEEWGGE